MYIRHTDLLKNLKLWFGKRGKYFGFTLFIAACVLGPALIKPLAAYEPEFPKGAFYSPSINIEKSDKYPAFFSILERKNYRLAYTPTITVSNDVKPASQYEVKIKVLDSNGETSYTETLKTDSIGEFFTSISLKPYANTIVARDPWGNVLAVDVFYLRGRSYINAPPPIPRTTTLNLTSTKNEAIYTADFSNSVVSPDFNDLKSGKIGGDLFVKRIFYPGSEAFTGREFSTLETRFAVDPQSTRVTITATISEHEPIASNVSHLLDITHQPDGAYTAPTTVVLYLDPTLRLTSPPGIWPDSWQDNRLEWKDPSKAISINYRSNNELMFTNAFAESLRKSFQSALSHLNPELTYPLPFAPLIPFIWFLLSRPIQALIPKQTRARRNFLVLLTALMWLIPVIFGLILDPPFLDKPPVKDWYLWALSLSFFALVYPVYRLSIKQNNSAASIVFLKWVTLILAALILSLGSLFLEQFFQLVLVLAVFLVLWVWIWLSCELYAPGKYQFSGVTFSSWSSRIGMGIVLVILALPISGSTIDFNPVIGWQFQHWRDFYFIFVYLLLPYTLIPELIQILKYWKQDLMLARRGRGLWSLGRLIFAVYVVGFLGVGYSTMNAEGFIRSTQFSFIPFLIAILWAYPALVKHKLNQNLLNLPEVRNELNARPEKVVSMRRLNWEVRQKNALKEEVGDEKGKKRTAKYKLPGAYDVRKSIFNFGPTLNPWENAKLSLLYGLILTTVMFAVYAPFLWQRAVQVVNTPFPLLQILGVIVLPFFAKWLSAAFLLGYFFPYIHGSNGLQKGFFTALAVLGCTFTSNLLYIFNTMGDPLALLWETLQTILFLTFLGFWAFDLNTVKRYGSGLREFLGDYGLGFIFSFLSTFAGSFGLVLTGILTGRLESIIQSVIDLLLRGGISFFGGH